MTRYRLPTRALTTVLIAMGTPLVAFTEADAQIFSPGFYVGDNARTRGEIHSLKIGTAGAKPRHVFSRAAKPTKADPKPNLQLRSFAFDTEGSLYLCNGLDRHIYKVDAKDHAEWPVERLFLSHPGAIGQVRQVVCDEKKGHLYYSVVATPRNFEPLADGEIWTVPRGQTVPRLVRKIAQKDVGRDWWGAFTIDGDDLYVATLRKPARVYRAAMGKPPTQVFKIDAEEIHSLAMSGDSMYLANGHGKIFASTRFKAASVLADQGRAFAMESFAFHRGPARPPVGPFLAGPLFYIVAPDAFHEALAPYVKHKQKYFKTELVSLEKVLKTSKGVDDPERLKRFLFEGWKNRKLGYVLLVGDVDVMPVRYMVLDRIDPKAFDYAFYPSDLYYSDLAKKDGSFDNWNAQHDGFHAQYFGEVRGEKNKRDPINFDQVDYHPDVSVGRWPVSTVNQVRMLAKKSMAYEESVLYGKHPGLRRATLFAIGGWVDSRPTLNIVARALPTGWHCDKHYYGDRVAPSEKQLIEALGAGQTLVIHAGHGSDFTWHGLFGLAALDRVKNQDRLPIMISIGCSTATFAPLPPYQAYVDIHGATHKGTNSGEVFKSPPPPPAPYQKKYNPSGLGEAVLLRHDNGAVAYIGCNTGSQPCALSLAEGFAVSLGRRTPARLGDCWGGAIAHYYTKEKLGTLRPNDDWYPPSIFFQGMKFMLFGDPTLPIPGAGRK